jgi:hypothetical protein
LSENPLHAGRVFSVTLVKTQGKIMSKSILLLAVSVFLFSFANAQTRKEFTHSAETYIEELSDFMSDAKKREGKDLVENEFEPIFLSTAFTAEDFDVVFTLSDRMLEERLGAYPEFESMIHSLMALSQKEDFSQKLKEWSDFLTYMMDDRRSDRYVRDVLANSRALFEDDIFFQSRAVEWKSSSESYRFVIDSLPKIEIENHMITCYSKGDSLRIFNTSGFYSPTEEKWYGSHGKVTWERAALDTQSTYATFNKYEITLKSPSFIVDSVTFHNSFFDQPLIGQLTEKVLATSSPEDASYPRFESYNQRLKIRNIVENVHYDGGFTMAGAKLYGSGTVDNPATMTFYREDIPFLNARALEFVIRPDRFTSSNTEVSITLEEDSIFHPNLNLKFTKDIRQLVLLRTDEGTSRSPYYNSYHELEMHFEAFYWNIDDPLIRMGAFEGSSQRQSYFESDRFYREQRYDELMGMGMTNPLIEILDYTKEYNTQQFTAKDLAHFLRISSEQIHMMLINLNNQGFVNYDIETRFCIVKDKLHNYVMASAGREDYDVLQFGSQVRSGPNAQLNLLNNTLLMKGIDRVALSDSQQVLIYPRDQELVMGKNRDFKCGGKLQAGNLEFYGSEYQFSYDDFQFDLAQVDSCRIYVEDPESPKDRYGNHRLRRVKNVIEGIAGTLKIDAPTNKGGVHSQYYPQFPIFNSSKESYVYYDSKGIQKGSYNRDEFYYQIEPFTIDSLDNFDKNELNLEGVFVSGGIFPDIHEPLGLQPDYSLGFVKETPEGGFPAYGGKANFDNNIRLDYNGLQGDGDLTYLTSFSSSENFVFFPDSTKAKTNKFVNNEQGGNMNVPKVQSDVVDLSYYPEDDYLVAASEDEPINFFEDEATLEGSLKLSPSGMTGEGEMKFTGASLGSNMFDYTTRKILADTSDFSLSQSDMQNLAFQTSNVNSEIDFDERVGDFESNGDETTVEFPANQYICYMDRFKWFMDDNEMELASDRQIKDDFVIDTDESKAASNFFSVNELQDSLNFLAPKAIYDIKNTVIRANKVKFITVADSKITPDSGKVVIRERAKMDPLQNATIVSNYVTQYHRIFNATVEIRGRKEYKGEGDYAYTDMNKRDQVIHFNEISVDSTLQTVAEGQIAQEDGFMLSPFFEYFGQINLEANRQNLGFEGGVRILHTCDAIERNWLMFESVIDPNEIYVPVDTAMRDNMSQRLGTGVMFSPNVPIELYGTFLSRKKDRKDEGLISAYGFLHYDQKSKQYKVGSKEKIKQPKLPGNLIALKTDNCKITGDGKIEFYEELGALDIDPVGVISHDIATKETTVRGAVGIDFFFDDKILKGLAEKVRGWSGLQAVDIAKTQYEKSIQEKLGLEESDELISELSLKGEIKRLPDALNKAFYLADVTFKWSEEDESYISDGPIGIASMGETQIFRYVKGKVEIVKSRSYDVFRMYFELDAANWYYIEYKNEILTVTSSDEELLTTINELDSDDRKFKDDDGNKFSFMTSMNQRLRQRFIERFDEFR